MKPFNERPAKEQDFIDQMARKLMVEVCDRVVTFPDAPKSNWHMELPEPYFTYAISKKWISADGSKVLSAGWDTAARFLKR